MKTILTVAFVILLASDVRAACFKPEAVEQMAKADYNERVTHVGPTNAGEMVRLYQNRDTGTWTLTVVMYRTIDGEQQAVECTLTGGEGWREITQGDPA